MEVISNRDGLARLALTGPLGPVLAAAAALDPIDMTARPADLDELFLRYYRPERHPGTDGRTTMNHTIALLDLRLRRRAIIGYALGLGAYAFAIVALYPSFKNDTSLDELAQSSSTLMAAFGVSGSLTSPTGWLNANLFNNFVPLIVIVLTVGYGAWCVGGQDEAGTLSLTATLPTTRRRMIADKSLALAVAGRCPRCWSPICACSPAADSTCRSTAAR